MVNRLVFEETVGDDDRLVIQLPAEDFRGKVKVIVEHEVEEIMPESAATIDPALELDADYFDSPKLSADEIAKSDVIGIWADREDMKDSVAWVQEQRRLRRERRLNRD